MRYGAGWIELKTVKEPPAIDVVLFGTRARGLEVAQENWLLQHAQAGGFGSVMIMTNYSLMLIPGDCAREINHSTVEQLMEMADFAALRPIDWLEVVKCL